MTATLCPTTKTIIKQNLNIKASKKQLQVEDTQSLRMSLMS